MVEKTRAKELDTGSKFILIGIPTGVLATGACYAHLGGGEVAGTLGVFGLSTTVTSAFMAAKKAVNFWRLSNKNTETAEHMKGAGNWALTFVSGMAGLFTTSQVPLICNSFGINNFEYPNRALVCVSVAAMVAGAGIAYRGFMRISEIEDPNK